jgi:hypothetical protein
LSSDPETAAATTTAEIGAQAASARAKAEQVDPFVSDVAPDAFRNLTRWGPVRASEARDNLVTQSALGDPRLVGVERVRELSGFAMTVELRRRVLATPAKTLLPLGHARSSARSLSVRDWSCCYDCGGVAGFPALVATAA